MLKTLVLGAVVALVPLSVPLEAQAQLCATAATGARCVVARPSPDPVPPAAQDEVAAETLVEVGQTLERGEYSMLLNSGYYGLPPVQDGWVYMRIGRDVYRVDWLTHEVLEQVTDQAARNF
jgi:hypothetical protein